MAPYSPFKKELTDIDASDLADLKFASEGWYIEYKREVPTAESIAKSISAFANTYGGWLFFGVAEESKESPVAGAFPGISKANMDAALQRTRQAIAEQVNPSPHFESRVIWGPSDAIGLAEDHGVICIWVPWSPVAPHVHRKGLIYRRVGDGSEPRPENDRFILDQLWRRADEIRLQYKVWHDRDPEFSKGESDQPYVRLMLVADLWKERGAWLDAGIDEVRSILGMTHGLVGAVPFDSVYTSAEGFIGRQLTGNDPHRLGLTWRLDRALFSDVIIPLPFYTPSDPLFLLSEMNGYQGIHRFVDTLKRFPNSAIRVVDLNYLFLVLSGVIEIQRRLSVRADWTHGFFAKAKILNAWRTTPFVDVPIVLDVFEKIGPPMCLDSSITSPGGSDPGSFPKIHEYSDLENEEAQILAQTLTVFAPIARAFGVPEWIDVDLEHESTPYYVELQQAGHRAIEVQRIRNERMTKKK